MEKFYCILEKLLPLSLCLSLSTFLEYIERYITKYN